MNNNWGYSHLKLSFKDYEEKEKWWLGRLAKIRTALSELLILGVPEGEIGIVVALYDLEADPDSYVKISFPSIETETWVKTINVKTQEEE